MKKHKYDVLYDDYNSFFELEGSVTMQLSTKAALDVCEEATNRGICIHRVEGGIWHNPGFEARLDSIWDRNSKRCPTIELSNQDAANFINEESNEHNAFIISLSKKYPIQVS